VKGLKPNPLDHIIYKDVYFEENVADAGDPAK
jgi:hypothetical protein